MHAIQDCQVQDNAVWGLNRISERTLGLLGDYRYDNTGEGVDVFIIDSGILISHKEFGGRATWGANFVGDLINTDCNGHGTHVAGTVGGEIYGVAKKVSLVAVKVLGCTGAGSNSGVISGIQFTQQNKKRPSVANMSLGGAYSKALNDAVSSAVRAGVVFVVAAGNDRNDACQYSPASAIVALTVGSTDVANNGVDSQQDIRSSFSNYGRCVKVLAPGSLITSAWYTSDTAINTISGTSMASPHVAGAVALYLAENPTSTPFEVEKFIVGNATPDQIDLVCPAGNTICPSTPNRILFSGCE